MKKNCKTCPKKCENCAEHQAKAFELEVDEEIQQERLSLFWKKYSWLVYTLIILILACVLGFESYSSWRTKIRLAESNLFEKSVLLSNNGHTEKAVSGFEELSNNGKTGYRVLAQLEWADLSAQKGEKEKAIDLLKKAVQSTETSDPLHQITVLSLVSYQLDEADPAALLETLQPVLEDTYFQGLATELAVVLLKKQNKQDEAENLIQKALQNDHLAPTTKTRLNSLLGE